MTVHLALLRGMNVGGKNQISMSSGLRTLFASLGFPGAQSLLQSGNVVFTSAGRTGADLERLLEAETEKRFKIRTHYFVRTSDEWKKLVAGNPFRNEAKDDPSHLLVLLLKNAPDKKSVTALRGAIRGPEAVHAGGRHAYITYPAGIGRSKLTISLIENRLGSYGTGRNWNTVLKLLALSTAITDS